MKGLKEYIEKHGKHFTIELAYDVSGKRWSIEQLEKAIQDEVYYNVTASTIGDMLYLTNMVYMSGSVVFNTIRKCTSYMLGIIGNFDFYEPTIFDDWLCIEKDFDFTPYI